MDQEHRSGTSLSALPEPVITVDERGQIASLNRAAEQLLGRDAHDLAGTPIGDLLWGDGSHGLDGMLERGATATVTGELHFRDANGKIRMADVSIWPVGKSDGQTQAVLLHDVTHHRAPRERLVYQAAELELRRSEVKLLEEEVRRLEDELATALDTRHLFYTSMGHELRTPVNAILGYSELLLEGIYGELSAAQLAVLRRSRHAAGHLQELVTDLLDLARIEAGRLDLRSESVDIVHLIDDLLDSVRPFAAERGALLRYDPQTDIPRLFVDPRAVRKILLHLLTNAIKYGGGGPVHIRCGVTVAEGDSDRVVVYVDVNDQGTGIAPEDIDRIFAEFVRRDRDTDGTGLGLSIARALSQALGGTLTARSTREAGSTFRLTLPLEGEESEAGALPVGRGGRQ
jgi:PAS domain S-box